MRSPLLRIAASLSAGLALAATLATPAIGADVSTVAAAADWEVCSLDDLRGVQFETHYSCPDTGSRYIHQFVSTIADDGSIGPHQTYVWRFESARARGITPPLTEDEYIVPYAKSVTYDARDGSTYQRWQLFSGPTRCWRTSVGETLQITEVSSQNCDTLTNPRVPIGTEQASE
jgi:hypothetical protein